MRVRNHFDLNTKNHLSNDSYMGIGAKPADFEDYWKKALEELAEVEPQIELIPSEFKAPGVECFDLYFRGVRGARVHAKLIKPITNGEKVPAVLKFHGYGHFSEDWTRLLPYALSGFCIAALDCRGQGGLSEDVGGVKGTTMGGQIIRGLDCDDPQDLLMRHIYLDTVELANIVRAFDDVDSDKVGTFGNSQGGGLSIICAALAKVNRVAAQYPFLGDYWGVYKMYHAEGSYTELAGYFKHFDPLHEREEEIFRKLQYIDAKNIVTMLDSKFIMYTGLVDAAVPCTSQYAIYNNAKCEKKVYVYPDFGHEDIPMIDDTTYQFMCEMKNERRK